MALNDTYFFTAQGSLLGRSYVHTLHFREVVLSVAPNPAQQLIDDWQSGCQAAWLSLHPTWYTLIRLTAQRVCGALPLPARVEEAVGLVGTRGGTGGEGLAPWLSIAVNEATGLAGHSRHGRFFVSGGTENDINGEVLSTGGTSWLGLTQAYCTAVSTKFGPIAASPDWRLVVHSRKLADVPGTQCQDSSTPVTSLSPTARLTTQRSRRA
jgi:hypothetical protein